MPLISVVMPVWNGEQYLRASVDSVLAQTFSDLELVVIDDGSTDKTLEILKSYADPRLRILETAHGGIVQALNFGIAQAKGEWIARLDADDIALPERLARQLERLRQEPNACLCGIHWQLYRPSRAESPAEFKGLPGHENVLQVSFRA
jgi:glycosyltransferase involved in cell wall biosynthesis